MNISLKNIHKDALDAIEHLYKIIIEKDDLIESLKCCGNCGYKDNKEAPQAMGYLSTCYECKDLDNWQSIN